jgi:glucose/arabinose dehydrogenase
VHWQDDQMTDNFPGPAGDFPPQRVRPAGRRRPGVVIVFLTVGVLLAAGCSSEDPSTSSPSITTAVPTGGATGTTPTVSGGGTSLGTGTPTTTGGSATPTSASSSAPPPPSGPPTVRGDIATGFTAPWSVVILPDASALVSQRNDGRIRRVANGTVSDVGTVPGVVRSGEGGLLGLALSPSFATDRLLYAYFTSANDNRIVRMTYDGRLGSPEVVLQGVARAGNHNGGRILFGPDGNLYVGSGDAGVTSRSQDTGSLSGKILRIRPDGSIPPDNPFGNAVWSYGHRNVQGLAFDSDGRLWASEFGQSTWDELNVITRGGNYGWPDEEGITRAAGMIDPEAVWSTGEASPSGIAIVGDAVYMAALRGERLWKIPIRAGARAGEPVPYLAGVHGRLRDVVPAPDGSLWVLTNNTDGRGSPRNGDDRILRVTLG